jgi:hypothetical protein
MLVVVKENTVNDVDIVMNHSRQKQKSWDKRTTMAMATTTSA